MKNPLYKNFDNAHFPKESQYFDTKKNIVVHKIIEKNENIILHFYFGERICIWEHGAEYLVNARCIGKIRCQGIKRFKKNTYLRDKKLSIKKDLLRNRIISFSNKKYGKVKIKAEKTYLDEFDVISQTKNGWKKSRIKFYPLTITKTKM